MWILRNQFLFLSDINNQSLWTRYNSFGQSLYHDIYMYDELCYTYSCSYGDYRWFSSDVTAAIFVSQNNEMAAIFVSQNNEMAAIFVAQNNEMAAIFGSQIILWDFNSILIQTFPIVSALQYGRRGHMSENHPYFTRSSQR